MRLLIYSQDGQGLGHLRRAVNIAREVLARRQDSNVLVLSDSPLAPFLDPCPGMDYLKLPTIVKRGRASWPAVNWEPSTLFLDIKSTLKLRAKVILKTFAEFKPDVVLVDHMPVGALGELKPMLDRAMRLVKRPALYLGLRDILDSPEVIKNAWTQLGAYEYLPHYDGVLIYGCKDIYDADRAYDLASHARQVLYCNYVGPPPMAEAPERPSGEPVVLVMGGGGADAFALASTFIAALPKLREATDMRAIILTGPHMPAAHRNALAAQSILHPLLLQSTSDDVTLLLRNVSAVVTMAGYNSLCEVLDANCKALVVPRRGPSLEQRIRCQLFSERGLIRVVQPDVLTPERLGEELLKLLADDIPTRASAPPLDGAQRVASIFLHGLNGAREAAPSGPA